MGWVVGVRGCAGEEGGGVGGGLLGGRGRTGEWRQEWVGQREAGGGSIAKAMRDFGLDPAAIAQARRAPNEIRAYLELHIEQGPCLEAADLALGVVTAINGARRLTCTFSGEAGHAGTVPMVQRKDALAAAAEWITAVETLTRAADPHLVATVGCIECLPGAVNVIPGEVRLTLSTCAARRMHNWRRC